MDVDPSMHSCPDIYVHRAAHPTQPLQLLTTVFAEKLTDKDLRILMNTFLIEV